MNGGLTCSLHRYSEYRTKREKEHQVWEERMQARAEKIARGEDGGPVEPDPTEEPEVGCLGLLKFVLYVAVFALLAGKFITGSFLWEAQLPDVRRLIPVSFAHARLRQIQAHERCCLGRRTNGCTPRACSRRSTARRRISPFILP